MITHIREFMAHPNAEDPLNGTAAKLWKTQKDEHDRIAKAWTERYAQPHPGLKKANGARMKDAVMNRHSKTNMVKCSKFTEEFIHKHIKMRCAAKSDDELHLQFMQESDLSARMRKFYKLPSLQRLMKSLGIKEEVQAKVYKEKGMDSTIPEDLETVEDAKPVNPETEA